MPNKPSELHEGLINFNRCSAQNAEINDRRRKPNVGEVPYVTARRHSIDIGRKGNRDRLIPAIFTNYWRQPIKVCQRY